MADNQYFAKIWAPFAMQPGKLHGVRTQTKEGFCQYFVRGGTEKCDGTQKVAPRAPPAFCTIGTGSPCRG